MTFTCLEYVANKKLVTKMDGMGLLISERANEISIGQSLQRLKALGES